MALNVTPTSGGAPYTFTADFLHNNSFNYGFTVRFLRGPVEVGACNPPELSTTPVSGASEALLASGAFVSTNNVAQGSCLTYRLQVVDPLGVVVDSAYVSIDNT